jgi:hypothetical protein
MRLDLAALLLSLASVARPADAPPATAKLELSEKVFDAGQVQRGTPIRHQFMLKNVGTAEMSVDAKPG